MRLKPGNFCPLIKKDCKGLECSWFMNVHGMNPNTGEQIDEWGCAMTWIPVILIENSQQQRQTSSAVESFRNEMVRQNAETAQYLLQATTRVMTAPAMLSQASDEDD